MPLEQQAPAPANGLESGAMAPTWADEDGTQHPERRHIYRVAESDDDGSGRRGRRRPLSYPEVATLAVALLVIGSSIVSGFVWASKVDSQRDLDKQTFVSLVEARSTALETALSSVAALAKENNAWLDRSRSILLRVDPLEVIIRELEKDLARQQADQASYVLAIVELTRTVTIMTVEVSAMQNAIDNLQQTVVEGLQAPGPWRRTPEAQPDRAAR